VVPVTFGHLWLRHFGHLERAVVSIDVVRVSKPVVCTLRLSVRVFIPLPDVKKPKTLVLTFWTLVLESFGNLRKHVPLYNRRFFQYGGGKGFFIRLWCYGRGMRSDHHSYLSNGCNVLWKRFVHGNNGGPTPVTNWHRFVETVCTRKSWWSNPRRRLTPVTRCFIGLSLPYPLKPPSLTEWQIDRRNELIYKISGNKQWDLISNFFSPPRPAHGFRNLVFVNWGVAESTLQINGSEPRFYQLGGYRIGLADLQVEMACHRQTRELIYISGTRDFRTPVPTPLQPLRTHNGPNRRCASIKTSRVYPQVINPGIYSLTRHEKTQNPGSDILNLGSRKFWKFPKTRSSI
jgi:hypothetical protein